MDTLAHSLVARSTPSTPIDPGPHEAALRRALEAARGVELEPGDDKSGDLWSFHVLQPEEARAVAWLLARRIEEADGGLEAAMAALDQMRSVPGWVIVSARRDADEARAAYVMERSLTAVQRASLQLWSEGIRTSWSTDLVVEEPAFYEAVGLDMDVDRALGVLWFGHAEKR
jgi:hypothetical protein